MDSLAIAHCSELNCYKLQAGQLMFTKKKLQILTAWQPSRCFDSYLEGTQESMFLLPGNHR